MSAFTDRLYRTWLASNGSPGYGALPHVGAQRRNRPEGYPKDQTRPLEGRRPEGRAGADPQGGGALLRFDAGGNGAPVKSLPCAPCGQSPPALSLASK